MNLIITNINCRTACKGLDMLQSRLSGFCETIQYPFTRLSQYRVALPTSVTVMPRNLTLQRTTVKRFKQNQKDARVHFIHYMKDRVFVILCASDVMKKVAAIVWLSKPRYNKLALSCFRWITQFKFT